jgi:D-lyxose ketol-isomerase
MKAKTIRFDNAYFYDASGKFLPEKAKDAYIALMRFHGYPVYPNMREQLWVSDYGTGQFAKLGLGARMWRNDEENHYMVMDIFLLAGQMLPEHWHEKPEKSPQKMEGWLVRYGMAHIVGEGEPNLGPDVVVPKCHMGGTVTVKHEVLAGAGDFVPLNRAGARHWQLAGPEGAILTEVANVHTGSAVRHSDQAVNDNFLGK